MSKPFRIAIAGLGTVGTGVIKIIEQNAALLEARAGRPVEIVAVSANDKNKDRGVDLSAYQWVDKAEGLASAEVDAVVELIGGSDGPALNLVQDSLSAGKHVVTANKALLAHHGFELALLAEGKGVSLTYEAAVAGGIPIIKALREGLAANKITGVYGILNGTCNYILTQMRETGRNFADVLKDAQDLGYAEADPAFDIGGVDAGHKLCLLTSIAFGTKPDFDSLSMTGIERLTAMDFKVAEELGFKIKLLGIAKDYNGKIAQSVEPCLVPKGSPLGAIEDVYNAVFVEGDFVETPLFTGRGAGEGPTASSVVADIIDLARGSKLPTFGIPADRLAEPKFMDMGEVVNCYYLRLSVLDQPGVMADIAAILRDNNVSMESVIQHGRDPDQPVALILTSHEARAADMKAAVEAIEALDAVLEDPCLMRIEGDL